MTSLERASLAWFAVFLGALVWGAFDDGAGGLLLALGATAVYAAARGRRW